MISKCFYLVVCLCSFLINVQLFDPFMFDDPIPTETKLVTYLKKHNVTNPIYFEWDRGCVSTVNCHYVESCCFEYLEQLFATDIHQNTKKDLTPKCISYTDSISNSSYLQIPEIVVWKGCPNNAANYVVQYNVSLVYHKTIKVFFETINAISCHSFPETDLIKLPNYRYCDGFHVQKIRSFTNNTEALIYFNSNCDVMNLMDLMKFSDIPSDTQTVMVNHLIQCVNLTFSNYETSLKQYYDLMDVPLDVLCNITQIRPVKILSYSENKTLAFKNIFCLLQVIKVNPTLFLSDSFSNINPKSIDMPSLTFLFDASLQKSKSFYTVSEREKFKKCKTKVESYENVDMCELENCFSDTYMLPFQQNSCPILNSYEKIWSLTLNTMKITAEMLEFTKNFFNLNESVAVNLYRNSKAIFQIEKFKSGVSLFENNMRVTTNYTDYSMYLLFKEFIDSFFSKYFVIDLEFKNHLDKISCPKPWEMKILNISKIYQIMRYGNEYNFLNCTNEKNNVLISPNENCTRISYLIITEGENLNKFLAKEAANQQSTFTFLNSSFVLRKVCGESQRNYKIEEKAFSEADFYITMILIPFSLLGLVITIITYTVHPILRSLPGMMVLAMCLCLLTTYCGFLAIAMSSGSEANCHWLVMITHFALVFCLCWMAMISIDSARTFATLSLGSKVSNPIRRFWMIWMGLFFVVVIFWLPGVVNFTCGYLCLPWVPVEYGKIPTCWLKGQFSITYGVTSPGMITSIISMIALGMAIFGFVRSVNKSKELLEDKKPSRHRKLMMLFSIKLAILTGFTFGMMQIAIMFKWLVVNYIFSALNSSLGIVIGILFNCNSRVLRLYKKRFNGLSTSTTSATSTNKLLTSSLSSVKHSN